MIVINSLFCKQLLACGFLYDERFEWVIMLMLSTIRNSSVHAATDSSCLNMNAISYELMCSPIADY